MHKYHTKTLSKINKLYKWVYDRTICATELSDSQKEVFAYVKLQDSIKAAYDEFKKDIEEVNN